MVHVIAPEPMDHLSYTQDRGLSLHRECRERFPRHCGSAIPTFITARVWPTCRDACRDRFLAVSFEVGDGTTFPAFPAHAQPAVLRIWQEAQGSFQYPMGRLIILSRSLSKPRVWQFNFSHRFEIWHTSRRIAAETSVEFHSDWAIQIQISWLRVMTIRRLIGYWYCPKFSVSAGRCKNFWPFWFAADKIISICRHLIGYWNGSFRLFLPEASFGLRVLSLPASVRPSIRPSVTKFVRAISHHLFKLESPNLDHRCKRPWLRSLLFWGQLTVTFKVKFNLKVRIYPILSLSAP